MNRLDQIKGFNQKQMAKFLCTVYGDCERCYINKLCEVYWKDENKCGKEECLSFFERWMSQEVFEIPVKKPEEKAKRTKKY